MFVYGVQDESVSWSIQTTPVKRCRRWFRPEVTGAMLKDRRYPWATLTPFVSLFMVLQLIWTILNDQLV
jgi:hypothetical protein